jgi:hypothetical protein
VREYRVYIFGADGHAEDRVDLKIATEQEARDRAKTTRSRLHRLFQLGPAGL